jgi:hypothetical protein
MSLERTLSMTDTIYQYRANLVFCRLLTWQQTRQRNNEHDPSFLIWREPIINGFVSSAIASR